jgi:AraC family transcriptional regulator
MDNPRNESSSAEATVTRYYSAFAASGESITGIWEEAGIAFLAREWIQTERWQASNLELTGTFNFYVQSRSHLQCGEFNAVPSRTQCRVGAIQCVRPDETVYTAGVGATKIFQVCISPRFLGEYLQRSFAMPPSMDLITRQLDDLGINNLAQAHHEAAGNGLSSSQLYFEEIREAILSRILTIYTLGRKKRPAETLVPARARIVVDYIEDNLARDLRLSELASLAGLSRAHFARSFRQTMGMPPHSFVLHRRLKRAMQLLRQRDRSVTEIAAASGFADAAHLSRCFKARLGLSPSLFGT